MLALTRLALKRCLVADNALVSLPAGVRRCEVFRNVVSMQEEELIYEEFSRVLQKEGQTVYAHNSSSDSKAIKQSFMEIHGDKDFTEVKNHTRKEIRRLPGFTWSPTFQNVLREVAPRLMREMPDTGRVIEHHLPGYEMHTEHPTVGSVFLYFNFLCDTVLEFDDEPTERYGQVYLPARSLLCVSDEARWGFRFGERTEDEHVFISPSKVSRRVEMDMRFSIQVWKLSARLIDAQMLRERLEEGVAMVQEKFATKASATSEKARDEAEAMAALVDPGLNRFNSVAATPKGGLAADAMSSFVGSALGAEGGSTELGAGLLGGDFKREDGKPPPKNFESAIGELRGDYESHRERFLRTQGILQEMKALGDAGQPINDAYLKKKISEATASDPERDRLEGFDAEDVEGTWERADAKARFYKAKMLKMDYDGTAYRNRKMPDITKEAPLEMRATVEKVAPHIPGAEELLKSFPKGR
ncbi:unnamed protein product [Phytomonas sp. EM1]|nr:unnamed protein product [Phytomonas sp. EM1]|eukprot:CCW63699.1 unnamed protein product [Phytomonas sp. isolate EM1]